MRLSISSFWPALERAPQRSHPVCDALSCRNGENSRGFAGEPGGIQSGPRWYCSIECFVEAARAKLFAMSNSRVVEFPRTPRLSLGLMMLSKGYLTAEQLRIATDQSQSRSERLDATLIRLGMATEKQITAARSAQWGYPMLAQEQIRHMVPPAIPRSILNACSAVPLHYSRAANCILLGFVHRIEYSLLRSIEQMTGCRVEACFITETDFAYQCERLTKVPNGSEIVEGRGSPEKMACILGQSAVDILAGEVEFTQCKGHIWVRLTGKKGVAHVVFWMETAASETSASRSRTFVEAASSVG